MQRGIPGQTEHGSALSSHKPLIKGNRSSMLTCMLRPLDSILQYTTTPPQSLTFTAEISNYNKNIIIIITIIITADEHSYFYRESLHLYWGGSMSELSDWFGVRAAIPPNTAFRLARRPALFSAAGRQFKFN